MLRAFLAGTFAIAALSQEAHVVDPPPAVRDVRMQLARGRITELAAAEGAGWVRRRAREIGPDGDRVGLVDFNTNPFTPANGLGIDIGSNWENGASNRATRMWRMSVRLRDATVTSGERPIMRDGRLLWDQF